MNLKKDGQSRQTSYNRNVTGSTLSTKYRKYSQVTLPSGKESELVDKLKGFQRRGTSFEAKTILGPKNVSKKFTLIERFKERVAVPRSGSQQAMKRKGSILLEAAKAKKGEIDLDYKELKLLSR